MPPKKQVNRSQPKYAIYKYTVIQFNDESVGEQLLFECIPDRWFLDETKKRCYWPPHTGAPFSVRAMRCEKPDDSWRIYDVIVISDGHVSYNAGFKIVREKCSQKYNTSSADEHIEAANYRRKHPVLSMQNNGSGSIEHIFSKPNGTSKGQTGKKHKATLSSTHSDLSADSSVQGNVSNFDVISSIAGSSQNFDFGNHEPGDPGLDLSLDCGIENSNYVGNDDMCLDDRNADTITRKSTSNDVHSIISPATDTVSASNRSRSSSVRSCSKSSQSSHSRLSDTGSNQSKSSRTRSNSLQSRGESIKSLARKSRSQSLSPSKRQQVNRSRTTESVRSASSLPSNVHRPPLRKAPIESGKKNSKTENFSKHTSDRAESIESNVSVNKSKEKGKKRNSGPSTCHPSRSRSIRRSGSRTSSYHSQPNRQHLRSRSRTASTRTVRQTRNHDEENRGHRGQKSNQCALNGRTKGRLSSDGKRNRQSSRSRRRNSSDNSRSRSNDSRRRNSSDNARSRLNHHSRNRSHRKCSPYGPRQQSSDGEDVTSNRKKNTNNSRDSNSRDLINVVQNLTETLHKNIQQFKEHDRRLHRMELTVNKIFVLVGDLNGNAAPIHDEIENDHGFEIPNLPIKSTNELAVMKRKLKNKDFRDFFLQHERGFCCPTKKSTDTVTISKYLMRFVSLRVRSKLTLKENIDDGATVFKDYHSVYEFLIDVMKAGYRSCNRIITNDYAHSALRVVWGRSKQYYREEKERTQR